MATKTDFTADEWKLILASPMLAGMAVTLADPSGLWGLMQEAMASGRALLEAKSTPGTSPLVKDMIAEIETSEGRTVARDAVKAKLDAKTPAELKAQVLAAMTEVGALLDAKAPAEAVSIKTWLKQIAEKVAEASTEGGFLGFGGVRVSDAEKASLAELATALRVA